MTTATHYAVIIGSGFPALSSDGDGVEFATRFGKPSAPVHTATLAACKFVTIARHGDNHSISPHAINYRANLVALQEAGASSVIALNTVGVVSGVRAPGELAVPEQLIDHTWGRQHTIFDGADGIVEHIDFTQPFSAALRERLLSAADAAGIDCFNGGVYAATQGPRLETAAEVDCLERDGADYVGMTAMPEAALARELGLEYACLAMIVNRAAGRGDRPIHEDVESSTLAARNSAMDLLRQFFAHEGQRLNAAD
jgi:purine nucleoside phosphorylase